MNASMRVGVDRWLWRLFGFATAVAIATPLIKTDAVLFSTVLVKAVVFESAVACMLVAWLWLLAAGQIRAFAWRPMVVGYWAWVILVGVAAITSIDVTRSFWSTGSRMDGIVFLLFGGAWLFLLASTLTSWHAWRRVFLASNVVCVIVDVLGAAQWVSSPSLGLRVSSTLGNTLYLADYLVLHLFIVLLLRAREPKKSRWRGFLLGSFFLHLALLVLTQSRATVLALGTVAVCATFYKLWRTRVSWKRAVAVAVVLVLLSAGSVVVIRPPAFVAAVSALPPQLSRVLSSDPGGSRLSLWRMAWEGFAERPLTGWGWDNFEYVFGRHVEPSGRDQEIGSQWDDRAHNVFLESLATTGVVGTIGYLAFWLAIAWSLIQTFRRAHAPEDRRSAGILLLAVLAHLIELLFLFDTPATAMIFLMLLAFASHLRVRTEKHPHAAVKRFALASALVATVALPFAVYEGAVLPVMAATFVQTGYTDMPANRAQALPAFRQAVAVDNGLQPDLAMRMEDGLLSVMGSLTTDDKELVLFSARMGILNSDRHPTDYLAAISATYATRSAVSADPSMLDEAGRLALRASTLAPNVSEPYQHLAEISASQSDLAAARKWIALAIAYALPEKLGTLWIEKGSADAESGNEPDALADIAAAESFGADPYGSVLLLRQLADQAHAGAVSPGLMTYAKAYADAKPHDGEVWVAYAILLAKNGDATEADRLFSVLAPQVPVLVDQAREELTKGL